MKWVCLIFYLNIALACTSVPQKEKFPIAVRVIDDENVVVPSCEIQLGGKQKKTNRLGVAQFVLWGIEGQNVQANIACPTDWKAIPATQQEIVLKSLINIDGKQILPVSATFICVPLKKRHVVIVKTNGIGHMPVELLGTEVAQTDDNGVAQFVVSGQVNEQIELVLNTKQFPSLAPQMPARQLKLPGQRRFLVFEQKFSELFVKKKRPDRKRQRVHLGPQRL